MSRELKFRAWDGYKSRWFYSTESMRNFWAQVDDHDFIDESTIYQYTGLKDKNGKEIYEGDIVKADDDYNYRVVWLDGSAHFALQEAEVEDGDFYSGALHVAVLEVIGNVHENPDLLAA